MVRLATALLGVLLLSACSNTEGAPAAAAAPAETPAESAAAAPPAEASVAAEQPAAAAAAESAPVETAESSNSALSFRAYDGRNIAIEDYKGKKVVAVLFFSTDCPHCQTTAQILAPIYQEYRAKGVEILGLAVNPSAVQNLSSFVQQYGVEFPVGIGSRMQWSSFGKFSVTKTAYVPHLMFVGKDGKVAEDHPGADTDWWTDQDQNIRASFDRLLAQ